MPRCMQNMHSDGEIQRHGDAVQAAKVYQLCGRVSAMRTYRCLPWLRTELHQGVLRAICLL